MRILILTFYYPPDLSAGSFRTTALVDALLASDPDLQIDVVTTQPNRYHNLAAEAPALETAGRLTVRRIRLPSHRNGMADQTRAFVSFARAARQLTRGQSWDLVFATSSRLMTAALGRHLAARARAPLYLDIRDLFTDTLSDIFARRGALRAVLPMIRAIERWTLRGACRISVVSPGFVDHVAGIVGHRDIAMFTNGIDDAFLTQDFTAAAETDARPLVLYAGNIGEGQGLETIVPAAVDALRGRYRFRIVGAGGRADALATALAWQRREDVELLPPVPRAELMRHYREADVLFLHLNDYAAFEKVLPSKLFEYAATGKPILAGVAGEAAAFIARHVEGAQVFAPGSLDGMTAALAALDAHPGPIDRTEFRTQFARRNIAQALARDIIGQIQK